MREYLQFGSMTTGYSIGMTRIQERQYRGHQVQDRLEPGNPLSVLCFQLLWLSPLIKKRLSSLEYITRVIGDQKRLWPQRPQDRFRISAFLSQTQVVLSGFVNLNIIVLSVFIRLKLNQIESIRCASLSWFQVDRKSEVYLFQIINDNQW